MKTACSVLRTTVGLGVLMAMVSGTEGSVKPLPPRTVVNLDGVWQVEQGSLVGMPSRYDHRVVVPGLIDLADPGFGEAGQRSSLRQAFWYRRTFRLRDEVSSVAWLKIHKAKYGTKVWLNDEVVGEHAPCFTPGWFDVSGRLKGQGEENVLVIRVGADRESMPQDMPTGWDFEKYRYFPGIYDSVEIILSQKPFIRNVQVAPDVEHGEVRVVVELDADPGADVIGLEAKVVPAKGRGVAGEQSVRLPVGVGGVTKADFRVPLSGVRLWSPDDPFLYQLELSTGADAVRVRFGMRAFGFEPGGKYARLNGQRIFLRGSNVTLYRFFEDAERNALPWDERWVRSLHRRFKDMHWNTLRYCIGFPPEFWYDIADEEGFLIQDEFPIWLLNDRKNCPEYPEAEKIIPEYTEWLRERWNHACVVIWDAQNESITPETGRALNAVRALDLSGRPWENGWAAPQADTDCVEAHPYLFINDWQGRAPFKLSRLPEHSGTPPLMDEQRKREVPIIINEYAWLWLTREGEPTCLTDKVYANLVGADATVEQRRRAYARTLAALTEFWRGHRACAGVLHFCALGYSRPGDRPRPEGGATSDHWVDVKRLRWEPLFVEFVRDAFNPLGVMLDYWEEEADARSKVLLKVRLTNDRAQRWEGRVRLLVRQSGGKDRELAIGHGEVAAFGRTAVHIGVELPAAAGSYTLVAEVEDPEGVTVRSLRDVRVNGK